MMRRFALAFALCSWVCSARADDAGVPPPVDVTVRAEAGSKHSLERSSEAVTVVDTRLAKQRTADLGEVLARVQGVSVRRNAGLGSESRFSLNGLFDDQVRFFLDGVPLELAGFPFGLANVPVNLVDQVVIYRGVVPVRLGADALGGAVDLMTRSGRETAAAVSYQVGSFGTHRVTADGSYLHAPSGFVATLNGFFDRAKNDYRVLADVEDAQGRPGTANVKRFHDGYTGYGAALELGVVDRSWARKLLLRGYYDAYDKELQNNLVMSTPYGEVRYGERIGGATLRYEQPLTSGLELALVLNYAHRSIDFVDDGAWVYDWYGNRGRARSPHGEISGKPSDQTVWQQSGFGRALLSYALTPLHTLRASVTPTYVTRDGEQHLPRSSPGRDPLSAERRLITVVSGLEYELNAFRMTEASEALSEDHRLQNTLFVKSYVYRARGEEIEIGPGMPLFTSRETNLNSFGAGDSLRMFLAGGLYLKTSYEYATRLPRPDEVFGNGVLVRANLGLKPEVSHNLNFGPRYELRRAGFGELTLEVNGFLRDTDRLIVLPSSANYVSYQNVYRARALGVEGALSWTSVKRYASLHANPTFIDQRNASKMGAFAKYEGDRIPNRPYLLASWGAQLRWPKPFVHQGALEPFYEGRYVHSFYRFWQSAGDPNYKKQVAAQIAHNLGITYSFVSDALRVFATFEVQNVSDAKLYDFYGAQRPGRAYYGKLSSDF